MAVQTLEKTDVGLGEDLGLSWVVILYNDDWHHFDDVVAQVQKATGCTRENAERITYEAHTTGRAIAYTGTKAECREVAAILREISLQVEIDEA